MEDDLFSFNQYDTVVTEPPVKEKEIVKDPIIEITKQTDTSNIAPNKPQPFKRVINFEELPPNTDQILDLNTRKNIIEKFTADQPMSIPVEQGGYISHLGLILSPNLRELELMIRGLEYVKRFNPISGKEEVILRKVEGHPLNEYGINKIMEFLKIYSSPEIKLGRKRIQDYYNSVHQVGYDVVRLVYKNLKNFGMDTQVKQRNAKTFCLAIIEVTDSAYSRSLEGRENDASRPTAFEVQGNVDGVPNPLRNFNKEQKEGLKN